MGPRRERGRHQGGVTLTSGWPTIKAERLRLGLTGPSCESGWVNQIED